MLPEQKWEVEQELPDVIEPGIEGFQIDKRDAEEQEFDFTKGFFENKTKDRYTFHSEPKPWLPPKIKRLLNEALKHPLSDKDFGYLMENIAKITIDFYDVKRGKYLAIDFSGKIVESSDSDIELLRKIQGEDYDIPVFVWRSGSDSFTGWRR